METAHGVGTCEYDPVDFLEGGRNFCDDEFYVDGWELENGGTEGLKTFRQVRRLFD